MEHPIRLIVNDDLRRSRLTVFFRLLLVIPHLIVLGLWGIAVWVLAIVNWFVVLVTGHLPPGLHNFQATWLRYSTQVSAYLFLIADPYPPFGPGEYPVDLEIAPPERQNRWTVFFRGILVIPAYILAYVLAFVLEVVAFLGWFVCIFTAKMPEGMRNLNAFCLRYTQQMYGYALLLTQRYPSLSTEESTAQVAAPGT